MTDYWFVFRADDPACTDVGGSASRSRGMDSQPGARRSGDSGFEVLGTTQAAARRLCTFRLFVHFGGGMQVNVAVLKKQLEVQGDEPVEVIDVRLKKQLDAGDSYENVRSLLHQRMDKRFNEMFAVELGLMPDRVEEGARWRQLGMFDDAL